MHHWRLRAAVHALRIGSSKLMLGHNGLAKHMPACIYALWVQQTDACTRAADERGGRGEHLHSSGSSRPDHRPACCQVGSLDCCSSGAGLLRLANDLFKTLLWSRPRAQPRRVDTKHVCSSCRVHERPPHRHTPTVVSASDHTSYTGEHLQTSTAPLQAPLRHALDGGWMYTQAQLAPAAADTPGLN